MTNNPMQGGLFDSPTTDVLDLDGADVVIHRKSIGPEDADRMFKGLHDEIRWGQEEILMFGKRHPIPRLTAWFGDPARDYTYSGIAMTPEPWSELTSEIRDRIGDIADTEFNSVLLNLYRDGNDGVSWHADDEPELGPEPCIGSVSLGATRRFQLRRKSQNGETVSVELDHGDVLVMRGPMQSIWQHQIPKTSRPVGPRINLTFRRIGAPSD